jgi:hypothetical protein
MVHAEQQRTQAGYDTTLCFLFMRSLMKNMVTNFSLKEHELWHFPDNTWQVLLYLAKLPSIELCVSLDNKVTN